MAYETIEFKLEAGIARLTLNRPDRLNSFTVQMHEEVADALGKLGDARDSDPDRRRPRLLRRAGSRTTARWRRARRSISASWSSSATIR